MGFFKFSSCLVDFLAGQKRIRVAQKDRLCHANGFQHRLNGDRLSCTGVGFNIMISPDVPRIIPSRNSTKKNIKQKNPPGLKMN